MKSIIVVCLLAAALMSPASIDLYYGDGPHQPYLAREAKGTAMWSDSPISSGSATMTGFCNSGSVCIASSTGATSTLGTTITSMVPFTVP